MKKMKQASERMKKLKADKDARLKEQFEASLKDETEKKRRDEAQKLQKKLWMEEHQKEIKIQKGKKVEQMQKEQMRRVRALERQLDEERNKIEGLTARTPAKEEIEQEVEQDQCEYDRYQEDYEDEDAWSKRYREEAYTEHAP